MAADPEKVAWTRLPESPFDQHLGLTIVSCSEELVEGRLPVVHALRQPTGAVHGGVFASVAEGLASGGTNIGVHGHGQVGMGMQNDTRFLRPLIGGLLHAVARRRHRGASTWVWDVDMSDEVGRLCALSRVTVAVRPERQPGSPHSSA